MRRHRVILGLVAGLIAASAGFVGQARAADFDGGPSYGGGPVYGTDAPYLQPGVPDGPYAFPARRHRFFVPDYAANPYGQGYDPPYPPPVRAYPPAGGYAEDEPLPGRHCIKARQIQDELLRQGWRDFSAPQRGATAVGFTAKRPNGLTYRLKLDRCTGVIIEGHIVDGPYRQRAENYGAYGRHVPGY